MLKTAELPEEVFMKKKLLACALLIIGSVFGGQISIGVRIGPPPPPRVIVRPVAPGPGYFLGRGLLVSGGRSL